MIECPDCGASNREQSKFCGQCGRPLGPSTQLTCPMCDTPNPPEATVCSQCGARLLPLAALESEEAVPVGEAPAVEGLVAERPGGAEVEQPAAGELEGEELAPEREEPATEEVGREAEEPAAGEAEAEAAAPEAEEPAAEEVGEEIPAAAGAEPEEVVPPWLKKLEEIPPEEVPTEGEEARDLARGELPDWLEIPPEFEDMLSQAGLPTEQELAPAEVPPWIDALRPSEEEGVRAAEQPGGPVEATGLLRGIRGVLRIEPPLVLPRRAQPRAPFSASALAEERAQTFASVAAEPSRARVEVTWPGRAKVLAASSVRWIIYLIVAVSVAGPLLLGSQWAAANMRVSPGTLDMYDTIEALPADSVVLLSHDYDPAVAAEMIPQAQVVLRHLMKRGARLINVSLTPEGVALSSSVVEEAAQEQGYKYGEDYVNLGYVLGVALGPRSLAEGFPGPGWTDVVEHKHFSEFAVGSGVDDLNDIALIVEFAGGAEALRLWLEQVQGPYQVPMVAAVSATADPFARPYYHNETRPQLLGLMSGLVGAAEYELHSGQAGSALQSMDAQSLVHVAIVLLILMGNVAYFATRLRKA
jgi:hypothetical protein